MGRSGQSVDPVVFSMGSDELDEGNLARKIERDDQAIRATLNFKPDPLGVQNL